VHFNKDKEITMNYRLHENGWTVLLDDFDFANATQQEADQIAALVSSNMVVVGRGPNIEKLSPEDQVRFCSMIGSLEVFNGETAWSRAVALSQDPIGQQVQRVTGEKNSEGHPGLFGHDEELDWHNNKPYDPARKPAVWLKSVKGADGSKTSWTNSRRAYEDLKKEDPEFVADLEEKNYRIITGWKNDDGHTIMYQYWNQFGELKDENRFDLTAMPLVFTNESGHKGFFLPYLQTFSIYGMTKEQSDPILKRIWDYCQQEKYMYHHDWLPGGSEVVIAEQWLSVHKRHFFDKMSTRFMHRTAFDYTNTSWWPENKARFTKQQSDVLRQNIKEKKILEQI